MRRHGSCILWVFIILWLSCCIPALAQKPVPLPELTSRRLLNDLNITVASTKNTGESMTIGLVLGYGSAFDPSEKGGMAYLMSKMFMKATADKTAKNIQDELAYLNATLEVRSDWDGFWFVLNGESSKYERALLLLYQVIAEAQFTDADFKAVRASILQDLQKPPDPRQRIRRQLENVLFSGTTYDRPIEGDVRSITRITLGDIRAFYRKFFSPSAASLLVVGNVPPSVVLQRAARIWGIWVRGDDVPFTFLPPRIPAGRQIFLEDDPNSAAAQFITGNLFPRREDPAFVAASLAAQILQERLTKLLPNSLLTVGYDGRRLSSPFYVQGQAAANEAANELQNIRNAAEELKKTPPSQEELDAIQKKVIGDFYQELLTTSGICKLMLDAELYRLGSNYAVLFPDQVLRCDVDSIKDAANKYIFPGGEVILIRGPGTMLKQNLESLGPVRPLGP